MFNSRMWVAVEVFFVFKLSKTSRDLKQISHDPRLLRPPVGQRTSTTFFAGLLVHFPIGKPCYTAAAKRGSRIKAHGGGDIIHAAPRAAEMRRAARKKQRKGQARDHVPTQDQADDVTVMRTGTSAMIITKRTWARAIKCRRYGPVHKPTLSARDEQ